MLITLKQLVTFMSLNQFENNAMYVDRFQSEPQSPKVHITHIQSIPTLSHSCFSPTQEILRWFTSLQYQCVHCCAFAGNVWFGADSNGVSIFRDYKTSYQGKSDNVSLWLVLGVGLTVMTIAILLVGYFYSIGSTSR